MFRILTTSLCCVAFTSGAAVATSYECRLKVSKSNHTMPEVIYIEHDPKTGEAAVIDPFINHYFGKPIPAEVVADTAKRVTFGWKFENVESREGPNIPRVRVKANIVKATREIQATVSFGYGDSESGFGTCKVE